VAVVPADSDPSRDPGLPVRPERSPRLPLAALLAAVPGLSTSVDIDRVVLSGVTHDSRAVRTGDLYAALPGSRAHGADFAAGAVADGAAAVLTDPAGAAGLDLGVPVLVGDDPRALLGEVAAQVHGHPARTMTVLGVTGTNGKTTTAYLMAAGLAAAGHRTGLVGGVETRVGDDSWRSTRTTPESTDLQGLLALMRERGVTALAMEVSSHALALGRVDGVVYDAAAFTNLSQDHLDFHPDMAAYEAAKALLFTPEHSRRGVVNTDDPAGQRLARAGRVPTQTYGADGDWQAREVVAGPEGSTYRLLGPGVDLRTGVRLPGAYNVANAVAAVATLVAAGVDPAAAAQGVAGLAGVPGRMERVDVGQPFLAVVDFAHTPEAVRTLLSAVRAVTPGRVAVVLGCGGDRDRAKRPLMARAAAEGADLAVLTSDNPRSEDPLAILAEMAAGAPDAVREPDRRTAIALAVAQARPGDAVVVAGKGHETGQEAGGVVTPFDDREVLRALLQQVPA
jgi:UDP-N-acetylmuramoyl-L-alanyl-D-glutamate--2,6-diaminopimelate ligase